MTMTDPIADMLTRVRNANIAKSIGELRKPSFDEELAVDASALRQVRKLAVDALGRRQVRKLANVY